MDPYSYAISSSSSSSSNSSTYEGKKNKSLPPYYASLHGVRKHPLKPMTKQPIAPLPPTPPKIYKVEPIKFKEVVQMLTSAPEFQQNSNSSPTGSGSGSGSSSGFRRLQDVAPPPLDLSPVSLSRNPNDIAAQWREFLRPSSSSTSSSTIGEPFEPTNNDSITLEPEEKSHVTPRNVLSENYFRSCSPLANFPLSPASFAWFSSILLSPGTLPSPSAVL